MSDPLALGPSLYSAQIYRGVFLNFHPLSTAQRVV